MQEVIGEVMPKGVLYDIHRDIKRLHLQKAKVDKRLDLALSKREALQELLHKMQERDATRCLQSEADNVRHQYLCESIKEVLDGPGTSLLSNLEHLQKLSMTKVKSFTMTCRLKPSIWFA